MVAERRELIGLSIPLTISLIIGITATEISPSCSPEAIDCDHGSYSCQECKEITGGPYAGIWELNITKNTECPPPSGCYYEKDEQSLCISDVAPQPPLTGSGQPHPYFQCNAHNEQCNVDVAEECCFIIRSSGIGTFILQNAFDQNCHGPIGGCSYVSYEDIINTTTASPDIGSNSTKVYCMENIINPTCCSTRNGTLCQNFGNDAGMNIVQESGTCSNLCTEIANCTEDSSNDWCKCSDFPVDPTPPEYSITDSPNIGSGSSLAVANQTAKCQPLALAKLSDECQSRSKRSVNGCSYGSSGNFWCSWKYTCCDVYNFWRYYKCGNWWRYYGEWRFFYRPCSYFMQPYCGYDTPQCKPC